MKVKELMTPEVWTCGPADTLNAAARLMWDHDCGCVPVVDEERRVVGMLTDRDICMAAYTQGSPLHALSVERAMAEKAFTCHSEDSLDEAERIMQQKQIRRLPVTDDSGRLVGLLSLNDLARHSVPRRRGEIPEVSAKDVAVTLASVCAPHPRLVVAAA